MSEKELKQAEVVEAEFEEVVEEQQEGKKITCGYVVVITEDGDISIQLLGDNQNLVVLDGLHKYAGRYFDKAWEPRIGE